VRRSLPVVLLALSLALPVAFHTLNAQPPPPDFFFRVSAGGLAPWTSTSTLTIDSVGHSRYIRHSSTSSSAPEADTSFTLPPSALQQLWQSILNQNFATIADLPPDTLFQDGGFLKVSVRANSAYHEVIVKNSPQAALQAILAILNAIVPPSAQVRYTPPTTGPAPSIDPCSPGTLMKIGPDDTALPPSKMKRSTRGVSPSIILGGVPDAPHPGSVVAYAMDLEKAIKSGKVKLKSKGIFDGDAVSITGDNSHSQPSPSIDIKLYMDFWGPLATTENVLAIMSDILKSWIGAKTSGGIPIKMVIVPRLSPNATSPPGTPGYHQVELVPKDSIRSHCGLGPGVNYGSNFGTSDCQWEVGRNAGSYAHEAGHLLGLTDQYDNYDRQPDGTWSSSATNKVFANDNDFAQYVSSKDPAFTPQQVLEYLKDHDFYSVTRDGHENELMGNHHFPMRQVDIDKIVGHPGMLITVKPGDVLVSRDIYSQNILMTHTVDLFVPPGKKRSLNGLYGCCIDASKGSPDTTTVFDLAPPLRAWTGFADAMQLDALTQYIDSTGQFCGISIAPQAAIWRFTDNEAITSTTDALLLGLGIHPGDRIIDLPHLTSPEPSDTNAQFVVPDELFPGRIFPRSANGTIGVKATFRGSVPPPAADGFSTSFTWKATGPGNVHPSLSAAADSVSFTPVATGIYDLRMNITVNDPVHGTRTFPSQQEAYLVVPDGYTETFEHAHLADRYPWTTKGDALWKISTEHSHTGTFAVEGGGMVSDGFSSKRSTLEIHVSVSSDTVLTYFARWAIASFYDRAEFLVDSTMADFMFNGSDWTVMSTPLKAGAHTLQWTFFQTSAKPGKIWIDNIFFPSASVLSSTAASLTAPLAYELMQNYPNPFNPSTTITYGLPTRSRVALAVYNTLGQQVALLQNGEQDAGYHEVRFDASGLASGVYFYRIQASDPSGATGKSFVQTRKFMLIR
jgi:hypothetical protein